MMPWPSNDGLGHPMMVIRLAYDPMAWPAAGSRSPMMPRQKGQWGARVIDIDSIRCAHGPARERGAWGKTREATTY